MDQPTEVTSQAPTVEEAVDAALLELGVQQDAVEYEVVEEPGRRVLGFGGGREAKVRVWIREQHRAEIDNARNADRDVLATDDEPQSDSSRAAQAPPTFGETPELSDEDLDKVADAASETVRALLGYVGLEGEIEEYEGDEREIILDVVGPNLAILIGRHGRTLESLQALSSAITNRRLGFRYPVIVDVEGYRHRRRQKIEDMARRTADRVSRQHAPVRLRPMNAYERRVVHMALRSDSRVTTLSEGEDPFRGVVIRPA